MTRALKTSGFAGLAVMMSVGLYQNYLIAVDGPGAVPQWLIGGHAHLGVLSILAIVLGFAIPAVGLTDTLRRAVTAMFVVGQWALPLTVWVANGAELEILHASAFLWGALLLISMLIMAWQAAAGADATGRDPGGLAEPSDD